MGFNSGFKGLNMFSKLNTYKNLMITYDIQSVLYITVLSTEFPGVGRLPIG